MLLAIDIGNTNIVVGLYDKGKLAYKLRLATDPRRTADEYGFNLKYFLSQNGLSPEILDDCIISSVVPQLDVTFDSLLHSLRGIKPFFVNCRIKLNISLAYDNPAEIGADRIVNSAAAFELYKSALIILDFGTATTVEYLSAKGEYTGGLILPGFHLMKESLHLKTAKLPDVEIRKPADILGRNTIESIQSGLYYMSVGGLEFIIRRIRETTVKNAKVVATGGLAGLLSPDLSCIDAVEPDLTLFGLNFLYGLNRHAAR